MPVPQIQDDSLICWFSGELITAIFPNANQGLHCIDPSPVDAVELEVNSVRTTVNQWYVREDSIVIRPPTAITAGQTVKLHIKAATFRDAGGGSTEQSLPGTRDYPGTPVEGLDVLNFTDSTELFPNEPPAFAHTLKIGQNPDFASYFTPGWEFSDYANYCHLSNPQLSGTDRNKIWRLDSASGYVMDRDSGLPSQVSGGYVKSNFLAVETVTKFPTGDYVVLWKGPAACDLKLNASDGSTAVLPEVGSQTTTAQGYNMRRFTVAPELAGTPGGIVSVRTNGALTELHVYPPGYADDGVPPEAPTTQQYEAFRGTKVFRDLNWGKINDSNRKNGVHECPEDFFSLYGDSFYHSFEVASVVNLPIDDSRRNYPGWRDVTEPNPLRNITPLPSGALYDGAIDGYSAGVITLPAASRNSDPSAYTSWDFVLVTSGTGAGQAFPITGEWTTSDTVANTNTGYDPTTGELSIDVSEIETDLDATSVIQIFERTGARCLVTTTTAHNFQNEQFVTPDVEGFKSKEYIVRAIDSTTMLLMPEGMQQRRNDETRVSIEPDMVGSDLTLTINTGAPVKRIYELAVEMGSDVHLCVPYLSDPGYIAELAEYVAQNFVGRRVFVELSNELWNFNFNQTVQVEYQGRQHALFETLGAGFTQYDENDNVIAAEGTPGSARAADNVTAQWWGTAVKSVDLHRAFYEAFEAEGRLADLVTVLGVQSADNEFARNVIQNYCVYCEHLRSNNTVADAEWVDFTAPDRVATAPYSFEKSSSHSQENGYTEDREKHCKIGEPASGDIMSRECFLDLGSFDTRYNLGRDMSAIKGHLDNLNESYGGMMELMAYEWSLHMTGIENKWVDQPSLGGGTYTASDERDWRFVTEQIHEHPRLYNIFLEHMTLMAENGFREACHFTTYGTGEWYSLRFYNQGWGTGVGNSLDSTDPGGQIALPPNDNESVKLLALRDWNDVGFTRPPGRKGLLWTTT